MPLPPSRFTKPPAVDPTDIILGTIDQFPTAVSGTIDQSGTFSPEIATALSNSLDKIITIWGKNSAVEAMAKAQVGAYRAETDRLKVEGKIELDKLTEILKAQTVTVTMIPDIIKSYLANIPASDTANRAAALEQIPRIISEALASMPKTEL
jgi:hypothetical protein